MSVRVSRSSVDPVPRSPSAPEGLSIGAVARRTGLHISAIRYYESAGLIEPPRRVSGRRVFDPSVFESIALIRLAQDAGFTVAEIRQLVTGFDRATPASARWQALARRKLVDVVERIEQAQRMKELLERLLRCRCETLGQCVQGRVAELYAAPLERASNARPREGSR